METEIIAGILEAQLGLDTKLEYNHRYILSCSSAAAAFAANGVLRGSRDECTHNMKCIYLSCVSVNLQATDCASTLFALYIQFIIYT